MTLEQKLKQITEELKAEIAKATKEKFDEIYCDYLPYLEDDTIQNVAARTERVIEYLLSGKFEFKDDTTAVIGVPGEIDVRVKITSEQWDGIRSKLLEAMPACPKDLEIQSLKNQIEALENMRSY